jgi:DNA-directed RNA polymerase specialized sigma subunit
MLNEFLESLFDKNGEYYQIMLNITQNEEIIPELVSEISISYLENRENIENVIKQGYIKYFFIRTILNQLKSNTSPFHKNCRIKDNIYSLELSIVDENTIEEKELKELQFLQIDYAYSRVSKTYFQDFIFQEYFTKQKTFRQIAEEMGISHSLVFVNLKKILGDMRKKI